MIFATNQDNILRFSAIVEQNELHGLHFQHLALCECRVWLHQHRIDYAHFDDRMARGLFLHNTTKVRDTSVSGLMGLAPDRIDWDRHIVFEAKGGSGAQAAVSRQTAFYALMLMAATRCDWQAATDILPAKRSRPVQIDSALISTMVGEAERLTIIKQKVKAPAAQPIPLCSKCSYRFLCGFT